MSNYPLIKYVVVFICGVVLQSIFRFERDILLYTLLLSLLLIALLFAINKQKSHQFKSLLFILPVFIYGMLHFCMFKNEKASYPFSIPKYSNVKVFGKITNIELIRNKLLQFYVETDSITINDESKRLSINILCKVQTSTKKLNVSYENLGIGNRVALNGNILRPRDKRNPGEFDYEEYLGEKGITALLNIYNSEDIHILSANTDYFKNLIFHVRKSIDKKITEMHNQSASSLLRGLLLADRSIIDYELKEEFVNAGVIHVLAVSGLHVGFIVIIFVFLFKRFNVYARYILTIIGLLLFLVITNAPPSVTRATIMAIAMIAAPLTGRGYNSINSLALAALVILIFNPGELFNPGFQLSFSAVLSIVLFYHPISSYLLNFGFKSKVVRYLLLFCSVSLAAQIGTLPFTLTYFHKLSIIALFANLIVIPLIGVIVSLGIFTLLIGFISTWMGITFAGVNEFLTFILFHFVGFSGNVSFSFIPIYEFSLFDAVIFYLVLAFFFFNWKKLVNTLARIIVVVSMSLLMVVLFRVDNNELLPKNMLSVMAIDIGQGDAFLVKFPNDQTALIDAGDASVFFDNGSRIIMPLLDKLGIDKIDYGFISHVDSDHYRGFLSLINNNKIRQIYKPKFDSTLAKDIELEQILKKSKIKFNYYGKDILKIGNARLFVLNDTLNKYYGSLNSNDQSGILKIVYGNNSFLFTGDAGKKSEDHYVKTYGKFLLADVLKVSHHGSKTSTSEKFLDVVKPGIALISAGVMNKFKHPHKEVLDILRDNGVMIFRTDRSGAVLLRSNGSHIENINWKIHERGFIF